ncbi:hypothetical protein WAX74_01900 [Psychrobacillus sp. FJAT-51614]|uniref:Uncharacterized protein n=1 Tax=Psychrobacillus mangrovi TaxID=3117745 RepID=A0ABU8F0A1_9BACI
MLLTEGITFESLDYEGNALNLGEVFVRQEELPAFVRALREYTTDDL